MKATIVLGANQVIHVTGTADLGGGGTAVSNLLLDVCLQSTATDLIVDGNSFGTPTTPLSLPANARLPFLISKSFSPAPSAPADSYTVGLCGCVNGTDAWTSDFSWLNVQVVQK